MNPQDDLTGVGWRIASFMATNLEAAPGTAVTSTELWDAYRAWCAGTKAIPLALGVFLEEAAEIAAKAEIGHYQEGGHLAWLNVRLRNREAAHA